jgi:uncharacterized protein (DUF1810 family)
VTSEPAPDALGPERFVAAQRRDYEAALAELRAGRKRTHWIWYVLPQLRGLGSSPMAHAYGLASLAEARAYLEHPVLGPRIRECAAVIATSPPPTADAYFGYPDTLKVRSSMTLFMRADPEEPAFRAVLDRYYGGRPDARTDEMLGIGRSAG